MADCPACGTRLRPGSADPSGPHGRPELHCPKCGKTYRQVAEQLQMVSPGTEPK